MMKKLRSLGDLYLSFKDCNSFIAEAGFAMMSSIVIGVM